MDMIPSSGCEVRFRTHSQQEITPWVTGGNEQLHVSHKIPKARDHCILGSLIGQKAETVQVHFTLEG